MEKYIMKLQKDNSAGQNAFLKCRYGLFVHYVPFLSVYSSAEKPKTIDEAADAFDVDGFINDISEMRVEYLIFTAWHCMSNPLYPSTVMEKYRPGHCSKRDLIGEIVSGCKKAGIRVILYTHPRDGMEYDEDGKEATGWGRGANANGWDPNPETFDFQKWNDFVNELYAEITLRYGKDICGYFIDEGSPAGDSYKVVDYVRLNRTIHKINPSLIAMNNFYGDLYGCDMGMKEYGPRWNEFRNDDGGMWPCYNNPVAAVITRQWTSLAAKDEDVCQYKPEDLFRYTVLQAAANRIGGGIAWACGPYCGGGWEKGVKEHLVKVGEYINNIREAVINTKPSEAFPIYSGKTINGLEWGAATTSNDGNIEYIHLFKAPASGVVSLPKPADGREFSSAYALNCDKLNVTLEHSDSGIILRLNGEFDPLDTVIALKASNQSNIEAPQVLNDTSARITYSGDWEYSRWERNCGDYESDVHITEKNGNYYTFTMRGSGFRIITGKNPKQGKARVYIDNIPMAEVDAYSPEYAAQQSLYETGELFGYEHKVKVEKISGDTMELDAIFIYN